MRDVSMRRNTAHLQIVLQATSFVLQRVTMAGCAVDVLLSSEILGCQTSGHIAESDTGISLQNKSLNTV
jgi:hypothetical protein